MIATKIRMVLRFIFRLISTIFVFAVMVVPFMLFTAVPITVINCSRIFIKWVYEDWTKITKIKARLGRYYRIPHNAAFKRTFELKEGEGLTMIVSSLVFYAAVPAVIAILDQIIKNYLHWPGIKY